MQHPQPQAVGAKVFAGPVRDVDELGIDAVVQVEGEDRGEGDGARCLGVLKDRVGVDLVADEVELVFPAEARDGLDRVDCLLAVSNGSCLGTVCGTLLT